MHFQIDAIRSQFPALETTVNGYPAVFFDGPGGTQVPQRVIDRMVDYLVRHNSNTHGAFRTTIETDAMLLEAREAFANYFNCVPDEVAFCHNSTTISFKLAEAIARDLKPGDEVVITDIDHEANRGPWEQLAERGILVKSIKVNPETCTLDMEDFRNRVTEKTKVVAFNYASNAVGTISDAPEIIRLAKEAGAITIVDAVHFALHGVIDVRALDADFLFCSAYKFFGPHVGVLFGKRERMEALRTLRVGAQDDTPPCKFETGTLNHEGIAGAAEAVEFIADIGARHPREATAADAPARTVSSTAEPASANPASDASARRKGIVDGMHAVEAYEQPLAAYFKEALAGVDGLTVYGPPKDTPCTSTIAFRLKDIPPRDVAARLGSKGIFTWNGNFYAVQLVKSLGLNESGGLVRIGLAPYNTKEEIDRALDAIRSVAAGKPR